MESKEVNYSNIRYGMLVEVLKEGGYHAGCKVHFYNKKGVLIGHLYQFVPYSKLRMRDPSYRRYPRYFYRKSFETIRFYLFRVLLKIIDVLIRITHQVID